MERQGDNKEIKDFVSVEERILKLVREADNTEWYYVECTRMGRKRLAMKTFYKTKIGG